MEVRKVTQDNLEEMIEFLESLSIIKDINKEVVLNGEYVHDSEEIIGFLSFEEFSKIGLIRYFVFKKIVSEEIIKELFSNICFKAKEQGLNSLITMVVKEDAVIVFKELGFDIADKDDVFIEEINIKDTRFKDAIILKYPLI